MVRNQFDSTSALTIINSECLTSRAQRNKLRRSTGKRVTIQVKREGLRNSLHTQTHLILQEDKCTILSIIRGLQRSSKGRILGCNTCTRSYRSNIQ